MAKTPDSLETAQLSLQSFEEGVDVPEWIHLVPSGVVHTHDRRGPFTSVDASEVISNSFMNHSKLPVDENHAIDKAGRSGFSSPAMGWIVEMAAREDGIWGRVEWTKRGRALLEDKAYSSISPAVMHDQAKCIVSVQRASLVNTPNFKGLVSLNSDDSQGMDDMDFIRAAALKLGLADGASEADILAQAGKAQGALSLHSKAAEMLSLQADASGSDILAAIEAANKTGSNKEGALLALQSQMDGIAQALGLEGGAGADAILAEVKAAALEREGRGSLHAQITDLEKQLKDLTDDAARSKSEAYIDGELSRGRTLPAAKREEFIALHMENPKRAQSIVESFAILGGGALVPLDIPPDGTLSLNSAQADVLEKLGISEDAFLKTLKDECAA